jgi:hypothetical protein
MLFCSVKETNKTEREREGGTRERFFFINTLPKAHKCFQYQLIRLKRAFKI